VVSHPVFQLGYTLTPCGSSLSLVFVRHLSQVLRPYKFSFSLSFQGSLVPLEPAIWAPMHFFSRKHVTGEKKQCNARSPAVFLLNVSHLRFPPALRGRVSLFRPPPVPPLSFFAEVPPTFPPPNISVYAGVPAPCFFQIVVF